MLRADDVVELALRKVDFVLARGKEVEVLAIVVVVAGHAAEQAALRRSGGNLRERPGDDRVWRRAESGRSRKRVEIDLLKFAGGVLVSEDAVVGAVRQHGQESTGLKGAGIPALRETEDLVVEEDEEPVLENRTADVSADLVQQDTIARQAVDVVEVSVGVQEGIAFLEECTAVPFIGARLGDELDLHRAFAETFGA